MKPGQQQVLTKKHRDDLRQAIAIGEQARMNCEGLEQCGFPMEDQKKKIELADGICRQILKEQFGEEV